MIPLRSLKIVAPAALIAGILVVGEVSQAVAEGFLVDEENQMTDLVNQHRASHGLGSLRQDPALQMVARRQAQRMVAAGYIYHNPSLAEEAGGAIPNWLRLGENVGVGGDVPSVEDAFLNSPPHHANIDNQYSVIGLGAMPAGDGRLYFTQNFALQRVAEAAAAPAPPPPASATRPAARAPVRRRRSRRRARVKGVELVRAAGPDDARGGSAGPSLPEVLGGMVARAGAKLAFWD